MAYGFYATNSSGFVQIDQDYSNFVLDESGTVAIPYTTRIVSIPVTDRGFIPLLFLRVQGTQRVIATSKFYSSNIFELYTETGLTQNVLVDWFTCTPIDYVPPPEAGYGMHVYKSDGSIAFSSNKKYQNIRQIIDFGFVGGTAVSRTFTAMPNGEKPYICANNLFSPVFVSQATPSQAVFFGHAITQPSTTQVTLQGFAFRVVAASFAGSTQYTNLPSFVILAQKPV